MTVYYYPVKHTNTTDQPETVAEIRGSSTETPHILKLIIFSWANEGTLTLYKNREKVGEIPTGKGDIQSGLEIPLDIALKENDIFKVELTNAVSGTNAEIVGVVAYEL